MDLLTKLLNDASLVADALLGAEPRIFACTDWPLSPPGAHAQSRGKCSFLVRKCTAESSAVVESKYGTTPHIHARRRDRERVRLRYQVKVRDYAAASAPATSFVRRFRLW